MDPASIAFTESRNLSPRKTPRERAIAAHTLLLLLESDEPPFAPVDLIKADVVPALLQAAQTPKRTPSSLQPDPLTPQDIIEMSDAALMLLSRLCGEGVKTLQDAGWHTDDDGTGRGKPIFIHPATGVSQETPPDLTEFILGQQAKEAAALAEGAQAGDEETAAAPVYHFDPVESKWALDLLFELTVLINPTADPLNDVLFWPARIRYHEPESLDPPRQAVTVVDVIQEEDEEEDNGEGDSIPHLATTRHLVLGPWHGVAGFRETEVDLNAGPGAHLESWYTCALCACGFLSTRKPGRGKVLILGLGGGAMPSFLSHYFPGIAVEAVESEPALAMISERWFGLTCDPPFTDPARAAIEYPPQHDEPESFKPDPEARPTRVRIARAEAFCAGALADPECRYDAILVDVYTRSKFPEALLNKEFFGSMVKLLREGNRAACIAVNAGVEEDRRKVEELMRERMPVTSVLVNKDVGRMEGDIENAVVVGMRLKEGETEVAAGAAKSAGMVISAAEWESRMEAVREMWPDAAPCPFKLEVAMKGLNDEILVGWGAGVPLTSAEEETAADDAPAERKVGVPDLVDRDDPAFALFD